MGSAQRSAPVTFEQTPFDAELAALRPQLYLRAMSLMQNHAAADDLAQATIERGIANQHLFKRGSNLKAWVMLIMRNHFIDEWRKTAVWVDVDPNELEGCAHDVKSIGPLDLLSPADVEVGLEILSSKDRTMFELAYFKHVSHREIAARFGMRANTVGTHLFRIKGRLRIALEHTYRQRLAELRPT